MRAIAITAAVIILATFCSSFAVLGIGGDTRVAEAAMKNDLEAVRALLKQAVDANSSQGDGTTALHWAAMNGNAEMAQLLIYAGATLKATTRVGALTPLYLAAQYGHAKVVEVLLKAGADAKAPTGGGITPLMMAASSGDADTIKTLIEYGAEVDAKETVSGQTAVIFAAAFDRAEAIRILARAGANINHKSNLITRVYNELADRNAPQPPSQPGEQGQRGQRQQPQQAPVPQVAGQPQRQTPPPPQGNGFGRGKLPRDPTRAGGNPKGQLTPLMYAARQGNQAAVAALLDSGAKINEVSADGSTALLLAAINGTWDVAQYLVEHGADVCIACIDGTTPLYGVFNMTWA